jgi:hypothetical protein
VPCNDSEIAFSASEYCLAISMKGHSSLRAKRLQYLKEIVPTVTRVGLLINFSARLLTHIIGS